MLEKVTHAVCSVEHRKAAFGRKSTAGEAPLAHMSGVAQVTGSRSCRFRDGMRLCSMGLPAAWYIVQHEISQGVACV